MLQTSALPWPTTLGLGTVLSIWLTLGIIVVLSLLLGYGALWLRKHNDPTDVQGDELSLADLRRMEAEGTITAEEFDAAKAALLARMGVMRGEALTTAEELGRFPRFSRRIQRWGRPRRRRRSGKIRPGIHR